MDYHLHTRFSPDGHQSVREACEAADRLGLHDIAITDHLDIGSDSFTTGLPFDIKDPEAYIRDIGEAKMCFPGLHVLRGVEIAYVPETWDETMRRIIAIRPEFAIGSVHLVDGVDPYEQKYYEGITRKEACEKYLVALQRALPELSKVCDVLGHLDYVTKFAPFEDPEMRHEHHPELLDDILTQAVMLGLGLEINTSGYRRREAPLPGLSILRRFRELGGEILTLGSDAHSAEFVGYRLRDAAEIAKAAGFSHVTIWRESKPVFEPLS